jgi:sulfatase modifying factor 1
MSRCMALSISALLASACHRDGPDFAHASPGTDSDACASDPYLDLVTIEAGSFMMGSPLDETGRNDGDFEAHEVVIQRDYCMGVTELTHDQYTRLGEVEGGWTTLCQGDCPIHAVSWYDVAKFTVDLSLEAGLEPCFECWEGEANDGTMYCEALYDDDPAACPGYRLPTEAEWEHAARAGSEAAFWNGGDLPEGPDYNYTWVCDPELELTNGELLADLGVFCGVDTETPHPVAQRRVNPWGLYDVVGNVHEWVHDTYDDPPSSNHWGIVGLLKGGAFGYCAADNRAAFRMGATRLVHWDYGGARIARTAPGEL